ncbi:MAG: M48 family metallopeptidase [Bacilli bacterium]|nr:M48 family metallopeptidase [Bacilli bacterium]
MKVVIDDKELEVVIKRRKGNKRTYLRVDSNMNISISTNNGTSTKDILKMIEDNKNFIIKNLKLREKEKEFNEKFYYLGKSYDIVYLNNKDVILGEDAVFFSRDTDIDKWLKRKASIIFKEELDKIYNIFPVPIPYPTLTIRLMKTRHGVCNVKTKRVTLNLNLIKRDIKYLDYVIVHELSHLVHPNHSKSFWNLVSKLVPDYKKLRKELNSYE